ncbi:U4/U5/U6 small nuclear ribonucleoprotein prp3 [Blastocladiella emersonii ATCC 22665]|nr:U4/U5/U6 small nuclear ribonucleoprotein prp3 [Blastocladiella emersonii ATCC 22665]
MYQSASSANERKRPLSPESAARAADPKRPRPAIVPASRGAPALDLEAIKRQIAAKRAAINKQLGIVSAEPVPAPEPEPAPSAPLVLEIEEAPLLDKSSEFFDRAVGFRGLHGRRRGKAKLRFVPQGKYADKAERMRNEARLAALKAKVSQSLTKTGVDTSALDLISDDVVRREAPPLVEWWDLPLTHGHRTYDTLLPAPAVSDENDDGDLVGGVDMVNDRADPAFRMFDQQVPVAVLSGKAGGTGAESQTSTTQLVTPITQYVQHPVPIQPPFESAAPPRTVILTRAERRKLRRQRRMEEQREKQDKIRLGLLPPDPPKVRLANLMRVLATESVQDPTQVEAAVRAQVAARQLAHEKANAARALTPEQRREKRKRKMERDAAKGIHVALFKCRDMSHAKLKFKIDANVQQLGLTGVAAIHKDLQVVLVEGGPRAIRHFKKLMLRRIKWTGLDAEASDTKSGAGGGDGGYNSDSSDDDDGDYAGGNDGGNASEGHCWLVWEGQNPQRAFSEFRFKTCVLEKHAAALFRAGGAEHHWNLVKSWIPPRYM